jgi:hypothetical protein
MNRVRVTTPIPTLDEFAEGLGLSKARRKSLGPIVVERRPQGDYVVKGRGSEKAIHVFATQKEAVERAREIRPNRTILVERVRDAVPGSKDKWRKP